MEASCFTCGKTFIRRRVSEGRGKYCSLQCRSAQRKKPATEHICEHCGAMFLHKREDIRFCSLMCVRHGRIPDPIERFWGYVLKSNACWVWTGHTDKAGYGKFSIQIDGKWKTVRAHRFAWEMTHGKIPDGLNALHGCDNPSCIRPELGHVFLGTQRENMYDKVKKQRQARGETNGGAVLTEGQVREIRQRALAGEKIANIAADYGIWFTNVYSIIHRRTWKHVL